MVKAISSRKSTISKNLQVYFEIAIKAKTVYANPTTLLQINVDGDARLLSQKLFIPFYAQERSYWQ